MSQVNDTHEKVLDGLREKRYIELILERPNDELAFRQVPHRKTQYRNLQVRYMITMNKTVEIDPRMDDDVIQIAS